jgi:hypothetical protein
MMHDLVLCDRQQTALFEALGRTRGLFQSVSHWPDIEDVLGNRSAALLAEQGERAWEAMGGIRDAQRGFAFKPCPSPAVAALMRELAADPGGFLWADRGGKTWAVRLVPARGNDPAAFHGFGLSWPGAGVVPGPARGTETGSRKGGQLAQSAPSDVATPAGVREQLQRVAGELWLYERAEQCLWALHAAVLAQRSSLVLLPDVLLGQIIWGGKRGCWPKHWRSQILDVLRSLLGLQWATFRFTRDGWQPRFGAHAVAVAYVEDLRVSRPAEDVCRPVCPLNERNVTHGHYLVGVGYGFLGALELFATGSDAHGRRTFDFSTEPEAKLERITAARRAGDIITVHLPAKLLGPHTRLRPGSHRIVQALVTELVRLPKKRKSSRPDRARLLKGNRVPGVKSGTWIVCPFLESGLSFADFNGNGKRPGRGYRLFGVKGTGWLHKAGYPVAVDDKGREASLRYFLNDLRDLAGPLGLIAVGLDPRTFKWLDLDMMIEVARVAGGWKGLEKLHLRVYGPADYLGRWRGYLACQANFSSIPGGAEVAPTSTVVNRDGDRKSGRPGLDLAIALQRGKIKQKDLARHLGVSAAFVSQVLHGNKKPSEQLLQRARDCIDLLVNSVTISPPELTSK